MTNLFLWFTFDRQIKTSKVTENSKQTLYAVAMYSVFTGLTLFLNVFTTPVLR